MIGRGNASSAIRWRQLALRHGRAVAKPQGGDRLSGRIEGQAGYILTLVEEQGDITLAEIQAKLAERGTPVGIGTVWRFFARHRITRKKRPATRSSRTVPTS